MLRRIVRPRVLILGLLLGVVPAILATTLAANLAFANIRPIFPFPVSPNGLDLYNLYIWISIPAIVIFLGVEAAIVYSIVKFRRSKRPAGFVPPQWHGNTTIEIVWTIIPLIIVLVIAGVSAATLYNDYQSAPGLTNFHADLDVRVQAYQFGWRYTYMPSGYTLDQPGSATTPVPVFVVPVGKVVRLQLQGTDVIHSWWVPTISGKQDAVPGYDNYTWFKIEQPGTWRGECAELCGTGHYTMQIRVQAMPADQFDAWLANQIAQSQASPSPSPSASPTP
ncbi:MAG TPA: cytochrome c oxidase subunit II [Candidatus Dormibacteraeota bacterium]